MTDRPIIFSAPMVRAILEGRKTQTRRVFKPQPELNSAGLWVWPPYGTKVTKRTWRGFIQTEEASVSEFFSNSLASDALRYFRRDLLWVKEAYFDAGDRGVHYKADWGADELAKAMHRWQSPLFCPRWASRITLEVKGVWLERLQDISEDDARAEGVRGNSSGPWGAEGLIENYADLWDSLHAKRGHTWQTNPWVVVIAFERVR